MVLMKLFVGKQWRHRQRTDYGHGREGGMYGKSNVNIHGSYVK